MVHAGTFENFFGQERKRLVAALHNLTGDLDVSADAIDEAMARAYARWSRLENHPEPAGWVFVTARNIARRRLRRANRHPDAVQAPVHQHNTELWMLVSALPDRQREAVVLRHVAGLTERSVGEAMGVTRGTVSSTLRDAYRKLETELGNDEEQT